MKYILRPLTPNDVSEDYVKWFRDPEIQKYIVYSKEDINIYNLKKFVEEKQIKKAFFYGIFCGETKKHIGNMKSEYTSEPFAVDFGVMIGDVEYRRRGVFSEVYPKFEEILKKNRIRKIILGVQLLNKTAIRRYEAVGFKLDRSDRIELSENSVLMSKML